MKGIFYAFNRSWEEAAYLSGASKRQVFYFINLPLAKPALFSAWLLVFIKGFTEFDVPAVIGLPAGYSVITSHIFAAAQLSRGLRVGQRLLHAAGDYHPTGGLVK